MLKLKQEIMFRVDRSQFKVDILMKLLNIKDKKKIIKLTWQVKNWINKSGDSHTGKKYFCDNRNTMKCKFQRAETK